MGRNALIRFQIGCKTTSEVVEQRVASATVQDTYRIQHAEEQLPTKGTCKPAIRCEACGKEIPVKQPLVSLLRSSTPRAAGF